MKRRMLLVMTLLTLPFPTFAAADTTAKGTLSYKDRSVALRYAYLIKGPDAVDPKRIIRRLILSRDDLAGTISGCKTMSCVDSAMTEGIQVDFDTGPRLKYWVTLNGGLLQYSGSAQSSAAKVAGGDAGRLAGTLSIDDTPSGGPKLEVEFAATLLKEITAALSRWGGDSHHSIRDARAGAGRDGNQYPPVFSTVTAYGTTLEGSPPIA